MFWIATGFVIFWSESQSSVRMWDDSIALGGVAQAIRSRTSSVKCQGKTLLAKLARTLIMAFHSVGCILIKLVSHVLLLLRPMFSLE